MNSQELKEKIAKSAASTWCRCFKCDDIVNDTKTICDKDKLFTCHQWYNGYRTAVLALGDDRLAEYLELKDSEAKAMVQNFEEKHEEI